MQTVDVLRVGDLEGTSKSVAYGLCMSSGAYRTLLFSRAQKYKKAQTFEV